MNWIEQYPMVSASIALFLYIAGMKIITFIKRKL